MRARIIFRAICKHHVPRLPGAEDIDCHLRAEPRSAANAAGPFDMPFHQLCVSLVRLTRQPLAHRRLDVQIVAVLSALKAGDAGDAGGDHPGVEEVGVIHKKSTVTTKFYSH